LQLLAATWQPLAATWQPLAATWQPLGSHLAATFSHPQTLAPSGCSKWLQQVAAKWLQVGAFFENQIAPPAPTQNFSRTCTPT
jgi:hypothetical protein